MVIYVKEWNGRKRTTGSQVSAWDPGVATLPDLTQMESVTYVNEIDVRKIAVGQPAVITLDADPAGSLTGTVASVANVGEQRPNADAKVFEVKITVGAVGHHAPPGHDHRQRDRDVQPPKRALHPARGGEARTAIPFVYKADRRRRRASRKS